MTQTDDTPGSRDLVSRAANAVARWDWLQFPGAVRAISRFVISLGEAGAAGVDVGRMKLEQYQAGISDDTKAKRAVRDALRRAVVRRVGNDPALVEAAYDQWARSQFRRIENLDAIGTRTADLLDEEPPPEDTPGPSDDWLNRFESLAGDATSGHLRDFWARTLAGEIRKPGSFSPASLHFVSVLDRPLAEAAERVFACVIDKTFVPILGPFRDGLDYQQLVRSAEAGLVTFVHSQTYEFEKPRKLALGLPGDKYVYVVEAKESTTVNIEVALLTTVGREVMSILSIEPDLHRLKLIAEAATKKRQKAEHWIGEVLSRAGDKVTSKKL